MKKYILTLVILILIAGCKKNSAPLSLIGNPMTVTRNGTNIQLEEINIFSPNGDGVDDYFWGPVANCQTDSNDRPTSYVLKILGTNINIQNSGVYINSIGYAWDGTNNSSPLPEGIYSYEVDYTTINGTAKATGLVRLWRRSSVPCAEKPIYRFASSYNSSCILDSILSPESVPCQ